MADFHRTWVDDRSFIRGAGRLLIAPLSVARPSKIDDVIQLGTTATNEVQTVTLNGTPTGGTFTLTFRGQTTAPIAYDAANTAVQTALQALSTIGTGNATVTGTGPWIVTFAGTLGGSNVEMLVGNGTGLTGGTTPSVTVAETTQGSGQYDSRPGWTDLGATKTGIQITVNNAEETFDVDQILGDISSQPTNWECSVGTQLAEMTPERMQFAWEGSAITLDTTPTTGAEQEIGFGNPTGYTQRRLAVLFQRPNGLVRGYFFHRVQRQPQESSITHAKTGDQISIPVRFRVLADSTIIDTQKRFFIVRDQAVS
jgi:hypothetical protein